MKIKSLAIRFFICFFLIFCFIFFLDLYGYDAEFNNPFFIIDTIIKSVLMSTLFSSAYILHEIRKGHCNDDFKRKRTKLLGCILFFIWVLTTIYFFYEKHLKVTDVSLLKAILCGLAYAIFNVLLIYMLDSILNRKKKKRSKFFLFQLHLTDKYLNKSK